MSDFFLGEIRAFAFGQVPRGWMPCQGQTLPIMQNQALFAIIGTTYGGDGRSTFNLPDLRGQAPLCFGPGYPQGAAGGSATHALIDKEIPAHTHQALASGQPPSQPSPSGNAWAALASEYAATTDVQMAPQALGTAGGSQPHNNMQPYLAINLCIAISGIFPPRQ
ncbi:phage tail protein [Massilia sp. UMI-21]|nr:phage tail protein [Massilia sp. UMI-21]